MTAGSDAIVPASSLAHLVDRGGRHFLLALTAFVVLLLLAAQQQNARPVEGGLLGLVILVGFFRGALSVWMCLLAWQLARMRVVVSVDQLELRARRYEWFITNPFGFRHALLAWPDVRGIRRWRISNPLAPGGTQENDILYTSRGSFVLSNLHWPAATELAESISRYAGLRIAASTAELPADLQEAATPHRTERAKAIIVQGLAWLAMLGGGLLLGLIGLSLFTGEPFRGSLAGAVLAAIVSLVCGESLRRFRLE